MALRLRRGLDIERQSITFAEGEPLYTTDTKQLYVGDGSTVGGNLVTGITKLLEDPTPQLGNNLDLNNYNITGVGNIDLVGDLTLKGGLQADFILADYRGSLFGNDSTMLVDGNRGVITASVVSGDVPLVDVDNKRINLHFTPIESLENVHADMPMTGDILIYNSDGWVASSFGTDPITKLPPPDHSLLQYSVGSGWIGSSQIISGDSTVLIDVETGEVHLGGSSIKTFGDVFIDEASLQPNEVLTWDGDFWTHKEIDVSHINLTSIVLDNVSNVNIPAPSVKEVLQYDGTQWVNGSVALANLEDVWIDPTVPIKNGQRLGWDGHHWVPVNNGIRNLDDAHVSNLLPGDILVWDGTQFINEKFAASGSESYQGSVIGQDSSVIVDAFTSNVYANEVTCAKINTERYFTESTDFWFDKNTVGRTNVNIISKDDGASDGADPIISFWRKSSDPAARTSHIHGGIRFGSIDSGANETKPYGYILGNGDRIIFSINEESVFDDAHSMAFEDKKFGVGTRHPSYTLDIQGEGVFTNYLRPGIFADATARDSAITAPMEGSMVFVQNTQKMQVYVLDTGLASGGVANSTPGWHDMY